MAEDATLAAEGEKPDDDDLRWARNRTGWAPKFVTEKLASLDEEGTLLDHQDFLEGRLPDKFFGDWYHNAAIIVFACLSSWMIAVLGGGIGLGVDGHGSMQYLLPHIHSPSAPQLP